MSRIQFSIVPGYFVDYDEVAKKSKGGKVTTLPGFGLLGRSYPSKNGVGEKKLWEKFIDHVKDLNDERDDVRYKVLLLTRHGLGTHNLQEKKVGTEAWDNDWARRDGDGVNIWADAHLVAEGEQQARDLSTIWRSALVEHGMPAPSIMYTSPLTRCLQTTRLVFGPLAEIAPATAPSKITIVEMVRERLWDHTCDRRSTKSEIEKGFPEYPFEGGFRERDELWRKDWCESFEEHVVRKQGVLEGIWEGGKEDAVVSLTTHSGAIAAVLGVCGIEEVDGWKVREGSTVAVLVRGERQELAN